MELLIGGLACALLMACVGLLVRRPFWGVHLAWIMFLLETLWADAAPSVSVGPLKVYPMDFVAVLLFSTGLLRLFSRTPRLWKQRHYLLLLLFSVLQAVSLVRGVLAYGLSHAGNEFRPYFYLWSAVLLLSTLPPTQAIWSRFLKGWSLVSLGLILIALARWGLWGLGLISPEAWSVTADARVLSAAKALFLAQALILGWFANSNRPPRLFWRIFSCLLLSMVILLQHRTVWAVLIASVLIVFLREEKTRLKLIGMLTKGLVIGGILVIGVFGGRIVDSLGSSIQEATNTENSTFIWRMEGWQALLEINQFKAVDYAIGLPFGAGYTRTIRGSEVDASPHDYYVQTFLRTGGIGLLLLLLLFRALLWRLKKQTSTVPRALYVLLWGQLVFFIPYAPGPEQGMVLGLALLFAGKDGCKGLLQEGGGA